MTKRVAVMTPSAGGGSFSSMSFVAWANTQLSTTCTVPASAQAGDWAIYIDRARNNPTDAYPSGWTGLYTETADPPTIAVSAKILESGDVSSAVTGMNGANIDNKIIAVFRPDAALSSFVAGANQDYSRSSGDPTAASITTSGATTPAILFYIWATNGSVAGDTYTGTSPTPDDEQDCGTGSAAELRVGYKIYDSGSLSTTSTVDMDDQGINNQLMIFWVEFS